MQAAVVLELGPQSGLIGDAEQHHGESGKLFPQAQLWRGQVVTPRYLSRAPLRHKVLTPRKKGKGS